MRAGLIGLFLMAATSVINGAGVEECDDKLLLVGRSVKIHRAYAAIHPASILIYGRPRSGVWAAVRDPRLQSSLKAAGHALSTVENERELKAALKSGQYDLVLADVADASELQPQAHAAPLEPTVLSVMYQPTKDEAEALQKQYNCRLTAADKTERYLAVIDDTMKSRLKEGRGKARKP